MCCCCCLYRSAGPLSKVNYAARDSKGPDSFATPRGARDLLNNYRISVLNIFAIFKKNPKKFILLLPSFITSIEKIAKASNIKTANVIGRIKIKVLLIIYFATFLTWSKDENPSLDKTMTVLDDYLQRVENIIKFFK